MSWRSQKNASLPRHAKTLHPGQVEVVDLDLGFTRRQRCRGHVQRVQLVIAGDVDDEFLALANIAYRILVAAVVALADGDDQ
jgi:hypothetical protein